MQVVFIVFDIVPPQKYIKKNAQEERIVPEFYIKDVFRQKQDINK